MKKIGVFFIDGSRADSGRPLFVIFFFKNFFFRVGPSRKNSARLKKKSARVGPSRIFFGFFFFGVFFFCFVFFWFFFFLEKILLWGGRRDPSRADSARLGLTRAEFFFRLGPTFFLKKIFFSTRPESARPVMYIGICMWDQIPQKTRGAAT